MNKDIAKLVYMGAAVGDAFGAPYEFQTEQEVDHDMLARNAYGTGGAHGVHAGEWTDDTAMARIVADSYIQHGRIDPLHIYEQFRLWVLNGKWGTRDYCFDIGGTCRYSISNATAGSLPFGAMGGVSEAGNGGLMRMAACITANWYCKYEATADAITQATMTHGAAESNAVISACIADMWHLAEYGTLDPSTARIRASFSPRDNIYNVGHALGTYAIAAYYVDKATSFEGALRMVAMRGGDSDTVACVAGMLGACKFQSIPDWMIKGLTSTRTLAKEADKLTETKWGVTPLAQSYEAMKTGAY